MSVIPNWFLGLFESDGTDATNNDTLADASVAISANQTTLDVGSSMTFTVTATDNGPGAATDLGISVPLGPDFKVSTATLTGGTYSPTTGIWSVGTLTPGSSATLTVSAVATNAGAPAITAQISGESSFDTNNNNNLASVPVTVTAPPTAPASTGGSASAQIGDQIVVPTITPLPASITVPGGAGYAPDALYVPVLTANQTVLTVGVGEEYSTVGAAVAAAQNGDVIEVNAGTYVNDFSDVHAKVTIVGVGGMVNMVANEPLPNEKGIMVVDNSVEIDNFLFTGGTVDVADGANGAGIRYEGGDMVLNNDAFIDNQDGVLAFPVLGLPSNTITINNSTFDQNGATSGPSSGYTHNIYVGAVSQFSVNNSVFEEANVGHELKSRALAATLTNNVFYDGPTGTASYDIDLPNGGNDLLTGNIIEKGPNSENQGMVHFGGEGIPYAGSTLTVQDNTFINDASPSTFGLLNQTTLQANITGNTYDNMTATEIGSGLYAQSENYDGNGQLLSSSASTAFAAGTDTDVFTSDTLDHAITLDTSAGVVGGGGLLSVYSEWGHVTVLGGTGGLDFYENVNVGGSFISTAVGSTNTLDVVGAAGDSVDSQGYDMLVLGGGNGAFQLQGVSTVISGAGANVFTVTGTTSIVAGGGDYINVASTGTATLTGDENYVHWTSTGGDIFMNITQGGSLEQATVIGGSMSIIVDDEWMEMQTASGGVGANITLGAGDAGLQSYGADTVHAGSGNATVVLRANGQVYAGTGTLDVFSQSASGASVYGASGNTLIDGAQGGIVYWGGAGDNTVQAALAKISLNGGAGKMTVLNATGDQITGGSGGIDATDAGGSTITTAFNASDTINGGADGPSAVISLGNDLINLGSSNSTLAAYGNATVTGSSANAFYDFEGNDVFNALGNSRVTVGGAAVLNAVSSGLLTNIATNGGKVYFSENANSDAETLTVTGGAGSNILSDATAVQTSVTTAQDGRTTVILGQGSESVSSNGVDTITGGSGADTIALNHNGASVTGGSGSMTINNADLNAGATYTVTGGLGSMNYQQGYASTTFFQGSGAASIAGGYGAVTVIGSAGNLTLVGGSEGTSYIGGKGNAVINTQASGGTIEFGAGGTSVTEAGFGAGVTYDFVKGHGGGTDIISNFQQGADNLVFDHVTVTSDNFSGGSTYVTLSDHTKIVFMGQNVAL